MNNATSTARPKLARQMRLVAAGQLALVVLLLVIELLDAGPRSASFFVIPLVGVVGLLVGKTWAVLFQLAVAAASSAVILLYELPVSWVAWLFCGAMAFPVVVSSWELARRDRVAWALLLLAALAGPSATVALDLYSRTDLIAYEVGHRYGRALAKREFAVGIMRIELSHLSNEVVGIPGWDPNPVGGSAAGSSDTTTRLLLRLALRHYNIEDSKIHYGCVSFPTGWGMADGRNEVALPAILATHGKDLFKRVRPLVFELYGKQRVTVTGGEPAWIRHQPSKRAAVAIRQYETEHGLRLSPADRQAITRGVLDTRPIQTGRPAGS